MKINRAKFCECGCGEIVKKGNRFVHGHNARCRSEEMRKKISSFHKNKVLSEEHKRKIGEANKVSLLGNIPWNKDQRGMYSKEYRNKLSESHKGNKGFWQGKQRSEETNNKIRNTVLKLWENPEYIKKHKGPNHPAWKEDSLLPYGRDWSEDLKEAIRKRDGYQCQICFTSENSSGRKHPIHHIDYDKENCDPRNLITLCIPCHAKTNFKRKDWISFFKYKMNLLKVENG